VDKNAEAGVDLIKIRVDSFLGTREPMSAEAYAAVIEQAHKKGLPVAAHLYYLDDAKGLLKAGVDFIAHSIRDKEVDDELIALLKERDICVCPTLTREVSVYVYESTPEFFSDPFFLEAAEAGVYWSSSRTRPARKSYETTPRRRATSRR
jgi:imidazolonepropionase-like amidohydrolase